MAKVIEVFGMRPVRHIVDCEKLWKKQEIAEEVIGSTRIIGIEVEVENTLLNKTPNIIWQQQGDGSLRNNGAEYITHPFEAIWAPYALKNLLAESLSTECCFGPRTSVHVHVNAQDLTSEQIKDITLMYCLLEELFYQFTGRGRMKNIYCVPIIDTGLMSELLALNLEDITIRWSKYTGYNLLPLRDKGTIEFRHMHGTFDHKKLSVWIRMITKLIDYCVAKGTAHIRKFVYNFTPQTDVLGLVFEIFGNDIKHFKNVDYSTIKRGVETTKQAYIKPETLTTLSKNRNLRAAYYIGNK